MAILLCAWGAVGPGRPSAQAQADPAAGSENPPTLQSTDASGLLTMISPTLVLAPPHKLSRDGASPIQSKFALVTGLARDAAGVVYSVSTNGVSSYLGRLDFATGAETTVGTIPGDIVVDLAFDGGGHLYALTSSSAGSHPHPHALLRIDPSDGSATLVKTLDPHGGSDGYILYGAIAWNPEDGALYYADRDASGRLFLDRVDATTFVQTPVLVTNLVDRRPAALTYAQGRLWLACDADMLSADAQSIAAGLTPEATFVHAQALAQPLAYAPEGLLPALAPCIPTARAACVRDRFRVEVDYDARPAAGTGAATVVLESAAAVKFTFFDPSNIELIVKLLDACTPPFERWWVFAGGLTNVGVTLRVTDTFTGVVRTYASAKGSLFRAFADTQAFACP